MATNRMVAEVAGAEAEVGGMTVTDMVMDMTLRMALGMALVLALAMAMAIMVTMVSGLLISPGVGSNLPRRHVCYPRYYDESAPGVPSVIVSFFPFVKVGGWYKKRVGLQGPFHDLWLGACTIPGVVVIVYLYIRSFQFCFSRCGVVVHFWHNNESTYFMSESSFLFR